MNVNAKSYSCVMELEEKRPEFVDGLIGVVGGGGVEFNPVAGRKDDRFVSDPGVPD